MEASFLGAIYDDELHGNSTFIYLSIYLFIHLSIYRSIYIYICCRVYFLSFSATDMNGAGRRTVVNLRISLKDENDNKPVFENKARHGGADIIVNQYLDLLALIIYILNSLFLYFSISLYLLFSLFLSLSLPLFLSLSFSFFLFLFHGCFGDEVLLHQSVSVRFGVK